MLRHTLIALAAASSFATPAFAHITARPDSGDANKYFQTAFTVPHGCGDGASTIAVRVQIPEGVFSVKPQFKPGWTVSTKNRKVDPPIKAHHGPDITETISEVEWRGGPLPDSQFDNFGLIVKLPATAQTLSFAVTQECDKGSVQWNEKPDGDHPAPTVRVLSGEQK
ncbi:YcnI family copper-binding membrane protein [Stenotrophobium rhamnosiphilum]|uniref:YncI copper-binding domain-containing protein n=1 Tax=Stenotrophobium rhamnosiphilum TaxID=2029166 RepID=A0A2T5MII9_9GAMM|nr:YcnI family protein [Stenotrophobium rhamnosiphilum]PTU32391.1 hypothetical protein CJD38_07005 [Stenotrophobium rhamnosiphilum]